MRLVRLVSLNRLSFTCNLFHQVKCEKYWPEKTGMYGDIKVTATTTRTFADYVTRMFIVEKVYDLK